MSAGSQLERCDGVGDVLCVAGLRRAEGHRRCPSSASEGCPEIHEHAELSQKNGNRDIAMKRSDLPIFYMEDVTARRVHFLSRRGNRSSGHREIAFMRAIQR